MALRRSVLLGAEVALAALTVIVTISLERLFTDTSFLRELLILVIGSHVVAALCRRSGLSMLWATPVSGLALIVLGTAVFYPEVSALIVPTSETVTVLADDLREAWRVFGDDAAPVPPLRGFLVTTAVLIWFGAFLADWAAFRLRSPLEAIAPATAVFVFGSLLGVDRNEITHGALFAAGVLAVLVTMRAERQVRDEVWVANGAATGVRTTLGIGAAAGLMAVVLAAAIAPRVPGATAEPLVDITTINDGPETRRVLSPLVEVAASLVTQSDTELFSVKVDQSAQDYWRLMALTTFEDEIWQRSSRFADARGPVESDIDTVVPTTSVTQEITIAALGNIYLPAAYEVSDVIDSGGIELEYEVATGALVIERGLDETPQGLTYTIESQVPDYSPADLPADAGEGLSGTFIAEHTQLPASCEPGESTADTGCWPTEINDLAAEITAGATTDHERVLALQRFFLDPDRFAYDLDVSLNHNIDSMTKFLEVGAGYCEQFASTFAAMARSLGIPTRVAVGFTWGEWDAARASYVVTGKYAHAWPEVYFAGVGWVIFDPTPGRSRGLDADITELPVPEQDGEVAGGENIPSPSTTLAPDPAADTAEVTPAPGRPSTTTTAPILGGPGGPATPDASDESNGLLRGVLAGAGIVLLVLGFVPGVQYLRRRRRLSRVAADPIGQGEVAWDDAVRSLRLAALVHSPDQTPHEFASLVTSSPRRLGPIRELADHVTALRYSTGDAATEHAVAAQHASAEVVRRSRAQVTRARLIGDALDPRSLLLPAPAPVHLR